MMTLREIADLTGGWVEPVHETVGVDSVASLDEADSGDISFYGSPKYLKNLRRSKATATLVPHGFGEDVPPIRIWVDSPAAAFAKVLECFAPAPREFPGGVHPTAVVAGSARIAEGVHIGPHVVIEDEVEIGAGTVILAGSLVGRHTRIGAECFLYPRVTIADRSLLGHRVILHPGVVIGSDGFGYEFRDGGHQKIPQTGIVQIDDDVEIGANTTVDRARFGRTWIKQGTKIDNLVQVGHNVTIGTHCILCAHVGISGSTRVGNGVTMAGKVGVNGHIEIGDGAIITAMAGITKSVPPKEILVGLPAKPMREYKENYVLLRNISKLYARVSHLENQASGDEGRTH
jgi:UDP-3-O-[3-hydroxymyristoyl] glucosamine N-acyltransferase